MDIKTAAQQAKSLSRSFKAIIDIGDFLETLGSLENAHKEMMDKIDAMQKEIAQVSEELKQIKSKKDNANAEVDEIINRANSSAFKILEDAKLEKKKAKEEANLIVADAKKHVEELESLISEKEAALNDVSKSVKEKQIAHNEITAKIKETLGSFKGVA